MNLKGKEVLVVGCGMTGVSVAKFLAGEKAKVTLTDSKSKLELRHLLDPLEKYKIRYDLGSYVQKRFLDSDLIVVSPGVPLDLEPLKAAIDKGIEVISEIELAFRFIRKPIIAVTGTNGKTTTSHLIASMIQNDGSSVYLCGNVGKPLIDYCIEKSKAQYIVCEVSSFQLETCQTFRPKVAVLLNVTEDHLDRHDSLAEYRAIKGLIFENQTEADYAVLNADDALTAQLAPDISSQVFYFSKYPLSGQGTYYQERKLHFTSRDFGKKQIKPDEMQLKGIHNLENVMAATTAAFILKISKQAVQKTINEFKGLEHRFEFVSRKNRVNFYNDSKGTNVDCIRRILQCFTKPVILIAGGRDKGGNFSDLKDTIKQKVKILILMGEAKEKINRVLGDTTETYVVGTLDEAVLYAYQKSRFGDNIVFCPGCSSFDMFENYAARGDAFKKIVFNL
ncbi:MAG: UDP-N-acetylmuramoyl-L-alanine--D-glutamate ligase [Deltaproteobacteria bacterium]|nr:UDP-N-acetylmuramoyl-L-alanine--D-glutamate ligase [Deltaproteobacteria bacterium]